MAGQKRVEQLALLVDPRLERVGVAEQLVERERVDEPLLAQARELDELGFASLGLRKALEDIGMRARLLGQRFDGRLQLDDMLLEVVEAVFDVFVLADERLKRGRLGDGLTAAVRTHLHAALVAADIVAAHNSQRIEEEAVDLVGLVEEEEILFGALEVPATRSGELAEPIHVSARLVEVLRQRLGARHLLVYELVAGGCKRVERSPQRLQVIFGVFVLGDQPLHAGDVAAAVCEREDGLLLAQLGF